MAKPQKNKSEPKSHDEHVKNWNERTFLENNQKIKYHSFTLLELFTLEQFEMLNNGLDRLFSENPRLNRKNNYRELLSKRNKLYSWSSVHLPYASTERLKGKVLGDHAFHNLGNNIQYLDFHLYKIMPSVVVLQIKVYLEDKVSEDVNKIIYQYFDEEKVEHKSPKNSYTSIIHPEAIKRREIKKIQDKVKDEAISFLKRFFSGFFMNFYGEVKSIVPTIHLFSLSYEKDQKKIHNWQLKNSGFIHVLGASNAPWNNYIFERYLFSEESDRDKDFENYVIFANRSLPFDDMYSSLDEDIEERIGYCSFDILALLRYVQVQEQLVGKINNLVSKEVNEINNNNFGNAITSRKDILKHVFAFQRFETEFNHYNMGSDRFLFMSVFDPHRPNEKNNNMLKGTKKGVEKRIKDINNLINGFTRQYETIIDLKNVEYSKKMQDIVFWLTILIIVLTVVQIIIGVF